MFINELSQKKPAAIATVFVLIFTQTPVSLHAAEMTTQVTSTTQVTYDGLGEPSKTVSVDDAEKNLPPAGAVPNLPADSLASLSSSSITPVDKNVSGNTTIRSSASSATTSGSYSTSDKPISGGVFPDKTPVATTSVAGFDPLRISPDAKSAKSNPNYAYTFSGNTFTTYTWKSSAGFVSKTYTLPEGTSYADATLDVSMDEKMTLTIPQTIGAAKVYDLASDDTGKVTLTLRNEVVAQYQLAIGQEISVKLRSDGSYSFIDGANVYQSDKDGWVTVGTGSRESERDKWKINFADGKLTRIESQRGLTYDFETVAGQTRLIKSDSNRGLKNYQVWNYDQKTYELKSTEGTAFLNHEIYFYSSDADLEHNFDFDLNYAEISFNNDYTFDPSALKPLVILHYDRQGAQSGVEV